MRCVLQAVTAFEAALEAMNQAGIELVQFDMGLLSAEGAEIEAELLLAYEMPREVSRSYMHLQLPTGKTAMLICAAATSV